MDLGELRDMGVLDSFRDHYSAPSAAGELAQRFAVADGMESGATMWALHRPDSEKSSLAGLSDYVRAATNLLGEVDPPPTSQVDAKTGNFVFSGGDHIALPALERLGSGWMYSSALTVDPAGPAFLNPCYSVARRFWGETGLPGMFARIPKSLFVLHDSRGLHCLLGEDTVLQTEGDSGIKHLEGNNWFGLWVASVTVADQKLFSEFKRHLVSMEPKGLSI
jgi:hypothetical protein